VAGLRLPRIIAMPRADISPWSVTPATSTTINHAAPTRLITRNVTHPTLVVLWVASREHGGLRVAQNLAPSFQTRIFAVEIHGFAFSWNELTTLDETTGQ
jgi:hypothetical protein